MLTKLCQSLYRIKCISNLYIVHLKIYVIWQLSISKAGFVAALWGWCAPGQTHFILLHFITDTVEFLHTEGLFQPCVLCYQHHFHNTMFTFTSLYFLLVFSVPLHIFSLLPYLSGNVWSLFPYFINALFGGITDNSHKGERMCLEIIFYILNVPFCFFPSPQAPLRYSDIEVGHFITL